MVEPSYLISKPFPVVHLWSRGRAHALLLGETVDVLSLEPVQCKFLGNIHLGSKLGAVLEPQVEGGWKRLHLLRSLNYGLETGPIIPKPYSGL